MRKVFALVGAIVFVDTAFYAAIVPLLPHYVDQLDLSQTQAGVLTASYAAGTLIASLPGGMCAARFGVKPTVLTGLSLMAVSSLVFGFGASVTVLDAARFAQGVGGAGTFRGAHRRGHLRPRPWHARTLGGRWPVRPTGGVLGRDQRAPAAP